MPLRTDKQYIKLALQLAQKGKGKTQPNPSVGAVLVKNNTVLATGYHKAAGADHAEVVALKNCKVSPTGATLYVTLEPCCHTGRTGPCTEKLIKAGIKRVVACTKDPNPIVNGQGFRILKKAGIEITSGVMSKEAQALNESYFFYYKNNSPMVTLKMAQSLDGRIATATGDSKYLSGVQSLKMVHQLRSEHDALMIGAGTLVADNPALNVRHVKGVDPYRIIVGDDSKLNGNFHVIKHNDDNKTIVASTQKLTDKRILNWTLKKNADNRVDEKALLKYAAKFGFRSILLEGGSKLATSFLKKKLVDKVVIFITPQIMGEGIASVGDLKIKSVSKSLKFKKYDYKRIGSDMMFVGYPDWK